MTPGAETRIIELLEQLVAASQPPPALLTIDDMAAVLRVSTRTLRSWRHQGELPNAITIGGGALRWRRTDVDAWLASRERAS